MKVFFFTTICILAVCFAHAQYAPQAGLPGSTAISASGGQFIAWATQCTVQRGLQNIAAPLSGYATLGDSSLATGPADLSVVSLGDSGVATLTFLHPIIDEMGPDFAVFENGFLNPANDSQAFLELAFVEVSSDGVNYFRFPATSLTQTNVQIGNGDYTNASGINNLAGKYIGNYGTPFDLQELAGIQGLDVNNITHVRIVDVVGSIGAHASRDSDGRIINDPYPTPFASCGFDLDAVGVIHQSGTGIKPLSQEVSVNIYPNPASDKVVIALENNYGALLNATLTDITGNVLQQCPLQGQSNVLMLAPYPSGLYFITLRDANGMKWVEKIVKR